MKKITDSDDGELQEYKKAVLSQLQAENNVVVSVIIKIIYRSSS